MKYSEYLQLRNILDENGVSWDEFKKNPTLYEGVLSTLGKGLWNLAKKGMKTAVSKGISPKLKEELNSTAEDIRTWILQEVKNGKEDEKHPIHNLLAKKEEAKKMLDDETKKTAARKIIRNIDRDLAKFLRQKVDLKVNNIEKRINDNKQLTEKDRDALQLYWKEISINLNITIAEALNDADIIEEETVQDWFKEIQNIIPMGREIIDKEKSENPETKEELNISKK